LNTTRDIHQHRILILDFGSQYTQLIARRVREIGVYCEILPWDMPEQDIRAFAPAGIIFSGGPESVTEDAGPRAPQVAFDLGVPILGICYGLHTMAEQLGGQVQPSNVKEFGYAQVRVVRPSRLFAGIEDHVDPDGNVLLDVWMSHGDKVTGLPEGFVVDCATDSAPIAAASNEALDYYGIQFHPEVTHTLQGRRILERFVAGICGCEELWTAANIIEDSIARTREQVGAEQVLLGLSGGVDSSVVAALLHKAIGEQLTCIFVDTGLLRYREGDQVMATFARHMGVRVIRVDAKRRFLEALSGVDEPEAKRKIIGNLFIDIFEEQAHAIGKARYLAQGTIYPDVIESAGARTGKAHVIRTVQGRGAQDRHRAGPALGDRHAAPVPRAGAGRSNPGRSARGVYRAAATGRPHIHRGIAARRPVRPDQPGVRRVPAGEIRGRGGRPAPLRVGRGTAGGGDRGFHDRPLGAPSA
jgi:GMP synthase (glutamine-hydrolysing)